jgi:hypothetical protein
MTHENEPNVPEERAPLYAIAYQESVRGLTQQAGVLDNARTRAGLLITAANVVTALLATQAIKDRPGLGPGGWLAIGFFLLSMALALYILWPRGSWNFAFDARELVRMIEPPSNYSVAQLHRRLALLNEESQEGNTARLRLMFKAFRWGCISLTAEVVLWVLVLAKWTVNGEVL